MKKILLILIAILLLASCKKEYPKFIAIDDIVVIGLKDSLMLVTMDYVVYNPNNVKTTLKESNMNIYYKDIMVGKGYLDKKINLAPNDTIRIPVKCEIGLEKLSKFYPELLDSESTVFTIKGESSIGFLLNSFKINIDDRISLNTQKIIQEEINKNLRDINNFKIERVAIEALPSLDKTNFKIDVKAKNNLPFNYEINKMTLQFYLDNKNTAVANWELDTLIYQKASSSTTIPVNVTTNNFSILKQTKLSWFVKGTADFVVRGEAQIQIQGYLFNVPINDKMSIDLKTLSGF